jgi:hypothetical protein
MVKPVDAALRLVNRCKRIILCLFNQNIASVLP